MQHAPAPKVEAPAPKPAPKPAPVFIPLARAGQVAPSSTRALTPKEALAAKTKAHAAKSVAPKQAARSAEDAGSFEASAIQATPDDVLAVLSAAGSAAVALVDAWATASNAAAIVEAAESDAVPAAARKAARRALNVLRARGVTIPARERGPKRVEEATADAEAVLTVPDAAGTFVVTITQREPSGRFHLAEVMIREPWGVLQAWGGWASGSQIKEARTRQAEGYGVGPVPVPLAWARHRVAAARKLNAISGQVVPLGWDRCAALLDPPPESEPDHPVGDLEGAVTSDATAAASATSGQLHAEPEFRGWVADRRALDELLYHLGARIGPAGKEMERPAFETALSEEVAAATDRYFTPEMRAQLASRMRDAAISVRARKGDRAASDVLCVAKAVVDAGLITSPPRDIPFLRQFFDLAIRMAAQQSGGELRIPVGAGAAPASG